VCHEPATSVNSAEGGTLFLCFLFHRTKAITAQAMRNKAAPVTPTAIAATFNDLLDLMANGPADVSAGELSPVGEGVNGREESTREEDVDN